MPNLCRLLDGSHVLPEHLLPITRGEDASTSKTPNERCNRFMALLSRPCADSLRNVGLQDPTPYFVTEHKGWYLMQGYKLLIQSLGFLGNGSPAKELFCSLATGFGKPFTHSPVSHQAIDDRS